MTNGTENSKPQLPDPLQYLIDFLGVWWKPIVSVGTAAMFILQVSKLYREDQRTVTWVLALIVVGILIVFLMLLSFAKIQDGGLRRWRYPRVCKLARCALVIVALFIPFGGWWVIKSHADSRNNIVVVLADLDNAKPAENKGIEGLSRSLAQQASETDHILIRQPGSAVRDQHEARALAERYGGRVVIWFRTESQNGEDRIVVELENLEQSNKTTGDPLRDPRTIASLQARTKAEQLEARASYIAGLAKYEDGQYDKAIALFTRALSQGDWQRDPVGMGYVYFLRGTCFYFSGRLNEAVEDYTKAIDQSPGLAQAYFNRALALSQQQNEEGAVLDYTQVIRLSVSDHGAYNNRGLSYIELAELKQDNSFYELAIRDFDYAIGINPQYAEAYSSRGDANSQLAVALSEAAESDDDNNQVKIYFDRALADYSKAIDLKPDYAPAYNNRADTYHELKRYDRAITDCTSAIQLNPKYADAFYNRGRAYYGQEQYQRAIDDYIEAIKLEPTDSNILYNRATAYFALAESGTNARYYYELARADYDAFLSKSPDKLEVYFDRGETLAKLGRCSEASKDFKKALECSDDEIKKSAQDWLRTLAVRGASECGGGAVNN